MDATLRWNSSASREVSAISCPKLVEVRRGYLLAAVGPLAALPFLVPGLLLVGPLGNSLAESLGAVPFLIEVVGWLLAGLGALVGFGLVLAGQLRCLSYVPQASGAKELLFCTVLCLLASPLSFGASYIFGGEKNFLALAHAPASLPDFNPLGAAGVLQITGALLTVVCALLFSVSGRLIAQYLRDEVHSRNVGLFLWYVAFLVGGTFGVLLNPEHLMMREVWLGFVLGWVFFLLWHVFLLRSGARRLDETVRKLGSNTVTRPDGRTLLPRTYTPRNLGE